MANVAHDFAMEVGLGFEDATCNKIPLDFGEPDLDLIEPRGVGGGVMELDVGVGAQEALDRFSLMSREVVGNNMNYECRWAQWRPPRSRNFTNSELVWRLAVLPRTSPVAVFKAA